MRRATSARKEFECPYKHRGPLIITQRHAHISLSLRIHGRDWEISDPSPISLASCRIRGPFARAPALALVLVRAGQLQLQLLAPHICARARTCTRARARNSRARQLTHTQVVAE